MSNAYHISINWSNAGNTFIANVPELSGCIADGTTFNEALDNVKLLIEEWMLLAAMPGNTRHLLQDQIYFA